MDPLLPRKPQDVDRWSDQAEHEPPKDPAVGPGDRWVNETARTDPDLDAPTPDTDGGFGGDEAGFDEDAEAG